MKLLNELLGSKTRAEILRVLFQRPGTEVYLRDLQRRSGMSIRPVQQEVARLVRLELLLSRRDGNRTYLSANRGHPLFSEVRSLVDKTTGATAVLKDALHDPSIQIAFIFGSIAKGTERAESDLDLFVVGSIGLRKVVRLLSGVAGRLGREINPHVLTVPELARKLHSNDHFITNVMRTPKTFLVGDESAIRRLGEEWLAQNPQDK